MHIYIHREKDVNKHWPNCGGSHRNIDSVWNESKSFFPYHRKDWTNNIHITFRLNERRFSFIVIYSHLFVIVHFFPINNQNLSSSSVFWYSNLLAYAESKNVHSEIIALHHATRTGLAFSAAKTDKTCNRMENEPGVHHDRNFDIGWVI